MNKYPETTRAILCTNVNGSGDDVMVFTSLTVEQLTAAYKNTAIKYDEMYEVPEKDLQFYLYEPCHLTCAEEKRALELAESNLVAV